MNNRGALGCAREIDDCYKCESQRQARDRVTHATEDKEGDHEGEI